MKVEEQQELNCLAKEFLVITKQTYDRNAVEYSYANRIEMEDTYKQLYDKLFELTKKSLKKTIQEIAILDVGTGTGKDIKYMHAKGVKKVIGLDNSDGIINYLRELQEKGDIPAESFIKGDMLNLPFEDNTFDIVRQNASLVHMPITTKGEMLDKAVQESYRVLKEKGILFVSVKKGQGVQFIDTKDGIGGRIFQMHTIESITKVLEENRFEILARKEIDEQRQGNIIPWINIIAKKCS